MTTPLPTNLDATYDDATDPTVKLHQQYHDAIHGNVPPIGFDGSARGAIDSAYLLLTVGPFRTVNVTNTIAAGSNTAGLCQVRGGLLTALSCNITGAAGPSGSVLNVSLYDCAPDGFAGVRRHTWAFPCDTTGIKTLTGLSTPIRPGFYWVSAHVPLSVGANVQYLAGQLALNMGHRNGLWERDSTLGLERAVETPTDDASAIPITGSGFGHNTYGQAGIPLLYWRVS